LDLTADSRAAAGSLALRFNAKAEGELNLLE
jgi:hypothetical protein